MKKNNILKIKDISVSYGLIRALNNISLEVNEGEIVVLIGANGAGKTSLLKSILGIQKAQSGSILFLGSDITRKATDKIVSSGICLIPEGHVIFSSMTVLENLQLGAYYNTYDMSKNLKRVFEWFPILRERSSQIGGTLSGGEQQMLAIGRGLMSNPKLMMVDEPSLGLAPKLVSEIFNILIKLNKEGYTILLAEQNAKKALECGNRGYVLEIGKIALQGNTQELMNNPNVRQAYLGSSV